MALSKEFPDHSIQVFNVAGRLEVAVGPEIVVRAPATMHYTALSWHEWLHRFAQTLREKMK